MQIKCLQKAVYQIADYDNRIEIYKNHPEVVERLDNREV